MPFPNDENGDVLRRMQAHGFPFSKPHDVEFFAIFPSKETAYAVARLYVADDKAGDTLVTIRTQRAERGGMELKLVKSMLVTHENVTRFESRLAERVAEHDGHLDGWGVMQDAE